VPGTLRLDVKSSGTGIVDGESNALSGGFIHGQPYTRTLGTVPVAWGYNSYGQLGLGAKDYDPHSLPVVVHRTGALAGKTIMAIAAGGSHSLALCSDGTLAAWGWNTSGQLGNGFTADSLTPVAVDTTGALAGKTVVTIAAGNDYSLALCSDGKVYAWGENGNGQLGNGLNADSPTPVAVDASGTSALYGKTVVAISAGSFHSLALCSDGTLVAWGFNSKGQLGNGTTVDSRTPVAVGTGALAGKTVVAISAGFMHSLALCRDGTLVAWGLNNYGQLGNGTTDNSPTPVAVITTAALSGKTVVSVAAGTNYSVALCSDGTAAMWGWNTYGQLGDGTTTDRHTPVAVNTASGTSALYDKTVVAITPGNEHLLALCSDGTVAVWGRNYYGQLGNDSTIQSPNPLAINSVAGSALVSRSVGLLMSSAAASHNFAFVSATPITAVATPAAGTYKLGDTLTFTLTPSDTVTVDTAGGTPRLALTIGAATRYATYDAVSSTSTSLVFTYTLATGDTDADGLAVAGAIDLNGGTITDAFSLSIDLSLPAYTLPVIAIDTTPPAVPAITSTAPVGTTANPSYTLTGTAEAGATVKIYNEGSLVGTVTADAEGHWSCALTLADGATALTVTASDAVGNESAAVADTSWTIDTTAPAVATIARTQPGPVTPADTLEWRVTFTEAVAGVDLADFELTVDGAATATLGTVTPGANAAEYFVTATGVAGIGTLRLDVKTGGTGISDALGHIMTRGYTYGQPYTHALGTVPVIWGKNDYGQLGLGFADGTAVPVAHPLPAFVPNTGALAGKTVVALAVGGGHTLALDSDGKVYAWGRNEAGQVGNGTTDSPLLTPVEVIGLGVTETRMVVAIAAGGSHSVALFNDGTLASWGANRYGQLGSDTSSGFSSSRATTPAAVKVNSSSALHGKTVVGIAAGMNYTLALCSDGTLAAWGYNNYGQLGNGTSTGSATPTPVAVVRDIGSALHGKTVVAMAAGSRFSAALCSDGTVASWGQSGSGELGDGTTGDAMLRSTIPVAVKADSSSALHGKTVVGVALGSSYALVQCQDAEGALSLASWGINNYGQLGIGTLETPKATPMAVKTDSSSALFGKTVVGLAVGSYHSLALCADGTLATWGRNDSGQLGDATTTNSDTPKAINDSSNLDLAGSALLGRTPYLLAPGSYAYHSAVLVSATPVTAVATPTAGTYKAGDTLSFTLTTEQSVNVTGTPRLALTIGTEPRTRYATYDATASAGTSLVFTYTVADGDMDADGLAVAGAIDLNSGTITDASSLSLDLSLPAYTLPTINVDGTAPATAITEQPATLSKSASAEFTFSATDGSGTGVAHIEASLDGAAYAPATSPVTYTDLTDGSHTLSVRAVDAAGNVDASPASYTWTIDTVAPDTTITSHPANPSASASAMFTFTASDGTGSGVAHIEASLDGGDFAAAASPLNLTGLAEGSHTYRIRAVDAAGNVDATPASYTWTVDTTAPAAPAIASITPTTVSGTAESGATVEVFLSGTSLGTTTADAEGHWSLTISPLADGDYSLTAQATDGVGNVGTASSAGTYTVDTVAPALTSATLISDNATPTLAKAGDVVTLNFKANEALQTPTVTLAGESATANFDSGTNTWTATRTVAAGDTEGAVTFAIVFSDVAGNAGTAVAATTDSSAVTIDLTAPETTIDSAPGAWTGPLVMFEFAGEDGAGSGVASYEVSVNGAAFAPATFREFFSDLPDGPYLLAVRAIDAAGNVDATPAAHRWTVDTLKPTLTAVTLVSRNAVPTLAKAGDVVTLSFRASETLQTPTVTLAGETVSAAFDSATNTWRATHTVAAGDVEGPVAFSIAYRDVAGNAGTAVAATTDASAVTIDLTAPETAITSQPASLSGSASATFAFGSADTSALFEASLDGVAYASATSPATYTGLSEGAHTFEVRAIDAAGNVDATPASYRWTIDLTPPEAPPAPDVPATSTEVSGRAEAGSTVTVYLNGVAAGTVQVGADGTWAYALPPTLSEGEHEIAYTVTDAAGNVSEVSAPAVFQVERLSRFAALSARAYAGAGEETLILGFVFVGNGKTTLVRGVGPGLAASVEGCLADPQLHLYAGDGTPVADNDDWAGTPALSGAFARTGAGALVADSKDAALLAALPGRLYTAHVSGAGGGRGVALAEAYDADLADTSGRLAALSVRSQVRAGDEILIAGFVITGEAPKRVVVRGVGPGLAGAVASPLADPELHVWKLNTATGRWALVGENDDWDSAPATAGLFESLGMGALVAGSKDAAVVLTLEPGIYTAQVRGVQGATGVGLVELYEAP